MKFEQHFYGIFRSTLLYSSGVTELYIRKFTFRKQDKMPNTCSIFISMFEKKKKNFEKDYCHLRTTQNVKWQKIIFFGNLIFGGFLALGNWFVKNNKIGIGWMVSRRFENVSKIRNKEATSLGGSFNIATSLTIRHLALVPSALYKQLDSSQNQRAPQHYPKWFSYWFPSQNDWKKTER